MYNIRTIQENDNIEGIILGNTCIFFFLKTETHALDGTIYNAEKVNKTY